MMTCKVGMITAAFDVVVQMIMEGRISKMVTAVLLTAVKMEIDITEMAAMHHISKNQTMPNHSSSSSSNI